MEVHTSDLVELWNIGPHLNIVLDKTHVPNFLLETFQISNYIWYQMSVEIGTRRAQLKYCTTGIGGIPKEKEYHIIIVSIL